MAEQTGQFENGVTFVKGLQNGIGHFVCHFTFHLRLFHARNNEQGNSHEDVKN